MLGALAPITQRAEHSASLVSADFEACRLKPFHPTILHRNQKNNNATGKFPINRTLHFLEQQKNAVFSWIEKQIEFAHLLQNPLSPKSQLHALTVKTLYYLLITAR